MTFVQIKDGCVQLSFQNQDTFNLLKDNIADIKVPNGNYRYEMNIIQFYRPKIPIRFFKKAEELKFYIIRFNPILTELSFKIIEGCENRKKEDIDGYFSPILEFRDQQNVKLKKMQIGSEQCEMPEIDYVKTTKYRQKDEYYEERSN